MRGSIKYYNEIRNIFPLKDKKIKLFLEDIRIQIKEYDISCNKATYEMFIEKFGTPQEVITSYFGENPSQLVKTMKTRDYIKKGILITLTFLVAIALVFSVFEMYRVTQAREHAKENQEIKYIE